MNAPKSTGFTLIEVVVALAILASTLYGGFFLLNQTTKNSFHLRDKVLANWVAANAYAMTVLENATTSEQEIQITEQNVMYGEEFLVTFNHQQTLPSRGKQEANADVVSADERVEDMSLNKVTISVAKASSPDSILEHVVVYQ